jgi:amino acid adenylation domain-containing protein
MKGKGTIRNFPLLQSQMSVFMGWEIHPTATAWNLPSVITFPKTVGADRLEAFMRRLVENQELHIRFVKGDDGLPRQFADRLMAIPIVRRQMSDEAATAYMNNDFVRPFIPYGDQPFCRFEIIETPTQLLLLSDFHHTIADGTSIVRLFNENQNQNQNASTPPLFQAALDEESYLTTPRYRESRTTMLEKFKGVSFPTLTRNTAHAWGHHLLMTQTIDRITVDEWCRQHRVDANLLLTAAFSIALAKLSHQQQSAFFVLNHGRTSRLLRQAFGMFVRSLPVLLTVDGNQSVIDYIKGIRHELMSTWRNSIYPSTHFCKDMQMKPAVTFGFQSAAMEETFTLDGKRYPGRQLNHGDVCNDLNATVYVCDDRYEIRVDASAALYDKTTLQMVADAVATCAKALMQKPDARLQDISLIDEDEQQRLITLGQGERLEYDTTQTWTDLFCRQAQATPDATAVVAENGSLTYQELDEQSSVFAREITRSPLDDSPFVCLTTTRKKEWMVQVIGVMKAGKAFVPIDPAWPEARKQQILDDIRQTPKRPNDDPTPSLPRGGSPKRPTPPAYLIYTSGSTGKPKGVMITHQGLLNLTHFIVRHWRLTAQSRISCHSPLTFDASVEDLFPVLTTGGTLYIVPDDIRMNLSALAQYLHDNQITGGCYTTRLGVMLAREHQLHVDYLCLGGEKLTTPLLNSIPHREGYRLINTYGPTECTVDATYCELNEEVPVPIGRPLDNMQAFVVDPHGQLLPQGAVGELWLAGPQVAAGYWNDERLTKEKFTACRFCKEIAYHTGDLVRWNAEGLLEFVGRMDKQIKRRGYRIETGEVEEALCRLDGIKEATVVLHDDKLCAYFTATQTLSPNAIRQALHRLLPDYMLPDALVQLETLPLNSNGKIDTGKLPVPSPTDSIREYVAPANERERLLCQAFSKVLQTDRIGVTDNFFECGGSSLTAMLLLGEAEKMGIRLTYNDIYEHPTVRELKPPSSSPLKGGDSNAANPTIQQEGAHEPYHHSLPLQGEVEGGIILLTGSTGFLGIHILRELIAHEAKTVCCLVRNKDGMKAEERLRERIRTYFGADSPLLPLIGKEIQVVCGDIKSPLPLEGVGGRLIIHCAADVRYFAQGTAIEDTNIKGTANVIDLCLQHHARLIHISTTSLESPLTPHSTSIPYLQSKRAAEELVEKAMKEQGLEAQIIRIGNLMPRKSDGRFQVNAEDNMFMRLLNTIRKTGVCPESMMDYPIVCSPVDVAAKEIVEGNYHVSPRPLLQIFKEWNQGVIPIRTVSDEAFMETIRCNLI